MFIPKIGEMIQFDSRIFFSDGWLNHQLTSDDYTTENQHRTWNFGWFFSRLLRWVPLTIKGFHDAWGPPWNHPWHFWLPRTEVINREQKMQHQVPWPFFVVVVFWPGEEDIYRYPWVFLRFTCWMSKDFVWNTCNLCIHIYDYISFEP